MTQTKIPPLFTPGQRLDAVVPVETSQGRKHYHRLGAAFVNSNGTIGVVLNSLPFDRSFRLLPAPITARGPADPPSPPDVAPTQETSADIAPADPPPPSNATSPRRRIPASDKGK